MAKVNYVNALQFLKNIDRTISEVSQEAEDLTIEMAQLGEERMKYHIENGGTNEIWGGYWRGRKTGRSTNNGGPSRVDSGDMLKAVGKQIQAGPIESRASFGWVNNFEEYFRHQEYGFEHLIAGRRVDGMFALRDARRDVVAAAPKIAKKYEKRIAKRLGQ